LEGNTAVKKSMQIAERDPKYMWRRSAAATIFPFYFPFEFLKVRDAVPCSYLEFQNMGEYPVSQLMEIVH
jgi:hypothetical protein